MTVEDIEHRLQIISSKDSNEGSAVTAFTELYKGYSKFLMAVVSSGLKSIGVYDEQVLNTVINNTFYILYDKPDAFSFPEGSHNDRSFKAWLAKVAKHELKRLLKEYFGTTAFIDMGQSEPLESDEINDEVFQSANLKMMSDALALLSERDREILSTLYLYYEEGKNTPTAVLDLLCKIHNTTKENIRQIKVRSEKKIIEYFSKHSQLKPLKDGR